MDPGELRARRSWLPYAFFVASGAAGLGYEVVWSRVLALGVGHEAPAMLGIVAAFLGGMALGAWGTDAPIARSRHPEVWYAVLEGLIGIWSVLLTGVLPPVSRAVARWIGPDATPTREWGAAFLVPLLLLLPATAAMGATFAAMERVVARGRGEPRRIAALYGCNAFGAVAGVLASTFWLMPQLGFRRTLFVFATVNVVCGLGLWASERRRPPLAKAPAAAEARAEMPGGPRRLFSSLALTGLAGIGYEVLVARALAQVLENTVYSFAAVLAVYLLGTTAGAFAFQRWLRARSSTPVAAWLLVALAFSSAGGAIILPQLSPLYRALRRAGGDSTFAVLGAEMAATALVLLLPSVLMGALCSGYLQQARLRFGLLGRALALNTLGGALAPLIFGALLLPAAGARAAFLAVSLLYLALVPTLSRGLMIAAVAVVLTWLWVPTERAWLDVPPGSRVVASAQGASALAAVLEDANGQRTLRVNNRFQMGGTATVSAERRHAHLPLLLHPAPRRALFLGLGTGITFGAAAVHPDVSADGVELLSEVVAVMPQFEPQNRSPGHDPRLTVHVADARRFVQASAEYYDVIVADLFHPAMDGVGALYSREHFLAIQQRLAKDGLFCQWLPLYQLDEPTLRLITRTFLSVFPTTEAYLLRFTLDVPVIGLVGRNGSGRYGADWIERRAAVSPLREELKQLVLSDSVQLFGCFLADARALASWAGAGDLNTDDFPAVTFQAPASALRSHADPGGMLLRLLPEWASDPAAMLVPRAAGDPRDWAGDVRAFIAARNFYLEGLRAEAEEDLDKAVSLYLRSCRESGEFTWSYARCLSIARLFAQVDPGRARPLLNSLIEARPSQRMAKEMLEQLP